MALVDIIIPTRNRFELTLQAARSVLGQTEPDLRLFVVDDGSDDGSADRLESQVSDARFVLVRLPKRVGPTMARQAGFEAGNSPWIALLDSDDVWLPRKLELQLRIAQERDADVVLCWFSWIRPDGSVRAVRRFRGSGRVSPTLTNNIDTPLAKRVHVQGIGGFAGDAFTPIDCDEHVDFMLRLLSRAHVEVVPKVLVHCHDHGGKRMSDDISSRPQPLATIIEGRSGVLNSWPDAKAELIGRLAARYLENGDRSKGLSNFAKSLAQGSLRQRLTLLLRYGPFAVRRTLWKGKSK